MLLKIRSRNSVHWAGHNFTLSLQLQLFYRLEYIVGPITSGTYAVNNNKTTAQLQNMIRLKSDFIHSFGRSKSGQLLGSFQFSLVSLLFRCRPSYLQVAAVEEEEEEAKKRKCFFFSFFSSLPYLASLLAPSLHI